MRPTKLHLLLFLLVGACFILAFMGSRTMTLLRPDVFAGTQESFSRDGYPPGFPFVSAKGARTWGSWTESGSDTGTLTFGPFPAPSVLTFGNSGFPALPGNAVYLEHGQTGARQSVSLSNVGYRWLLVDITVPPAWVGHPVRLVAVDSTTGPDTWLAIGEPVRRAELTHPQRYLVSALLIAAGIVAIATLPRGAAATNSRAGIWYAVTGSALLIALAKPWTFHTPQFWAEDGTVFLVGNDAHGLAAVTIPYMGYLHLIPRLVAWVASQVADPAGWPAFYNGAAFVITIVVLARFTTPRLTLPGKPWLILCFGLVAHTGEVLLTITNLQWITAFVLLQQLLIAPPTTSGQRATDFFSTLVVGLTGPFAILFSPLFFLRWCRDRNRDSFYQLAAVGVCCVVQAWFIVMHRPPGSPSPPFVFETYVAVLANRLVVWPVFGPAISAQFSISVVTALGCSVLFALAVAALRPHPRRALRLQVIAMTVFLMLAGGIRVRPDTWAAANIIDADRYFFIPRILVFWLIVWEFDASWRVGAWAARAVGVAAVLSALPHRVLPAPVDYRWHEHATAIRRGVPAHIPILPEGWRFQYPGRTTRSGR